MHDYEEMDPDHLLIGTKEDMDHMDFELNPAYIVHAHQQLLQD